MAEFDALRLLGEGRRELFVDARFDQKPRGRRAAFAIERVDHEHGSIGRALKIDVRKNDDGVFTPPSSK